MKMQTGFHNLEDSNKLVGQFKKSSNDETEVFLNWLAKNHSNSLCIRIMNLTKSDDCCRALIQNIKESIQKWTPGE